MIKIREIKPSHIVLLAVLAGAAGYTFGYALGYSSALNLCVDVAKEFTDIEINSELIKQLLLKYSGTGR